MSSEYTGHNFRNCGYRNLSNYYKGLYDNITTYDNTPLPNVSMTSVFGGTPYTSAENPDPNQVSCNTWRLGGCCDGRALSSNAYSQCIGGQCPSYGNLSGGQCTARY